MGEPHPLDVFVLEYDADMRQLTLGGSILAEAVCAADLPCSDASPAVVDGQTNQVLAEIVRRANAAKPGWPTASRLGELEAAAAAAPHGPWLAEPVANYQGQTHLVGSLIGNNQVTVAEVRGATEIDGRRCPPNAAIADYLVLVDPTSIRRLLAEIRTLHAAARELLEQCEDADEHEDLSDQVEGETMDRLRRALDQLEAADHG